MIELKIPFFDENYEIFKVKSILFEIILLAAAGMVAHC